MGPADGAGLWWQQCADWLIQPAAQQANDWLFSWARRRRLRSPLKTYQGDGVGRTEGVADCRQLIISCLFYPRKQFYPDPITDVREVSTETLSKAALTTVMWTFEAFSELALWTGLGGM